MLKFFENLKKYFFYSVYSAKSDLKSEVANSYLNWFWWILDPLAFTLIYIFIGKVVFKSAEDYFPAFVLIALTSWNFFNLMLSGSVKAIRDHKHITSKIYVPKYILLLQKSFVYLFKSLISYTLIFILLFILKVPITINILWFLPLLLLLYLISFGISLFLLHFGVYVEDLFNLTNITLKIVFYLTGIFYDIGSRVPAPFNKILLTCNPIAFIIDQMRNVMLYVKGLNIKYYLIWLAISIVLIITGIHIVQKHENSYAKIS